MNKLWFQMLALLMGGLLGWVGAPAAAQTRRPQFEPTSEPIPMEEGEAEWLSEPAQEDAFGRCRQDADQDLSAEEYFRLLVSDTPVGITVEGYPTILAYVPPTSASHIEVTIRRQRDGLSIYQSTMRIRPQALNPIQYPDYLPPLEVGEQYLWSVSLLCEAVVLDYNPVVQLTLLRQSPDLLASPLEAPLAVGRAQDLGEQGVWHDMLSRLYYEAVERRSVTAMQQLRDIVVALGIPLEQGDRL